MQEHNQIAAFMDQRKKAKALVKRIDEHFESQDGIKPNTFMLKSWKASRGWLLDHLTELEAAGWNRHLLLRAGQDRFPLGDWGPAWLHCWQQSGLEIKIGKDGTLYFIWPRSERGFKTMAAQLPENSRRRKMNRSDYINLAELKRRGWTIKLIADFKPEHDAEAPNPINPDWATQKLYRLETIQEIERDEYFQRRKRWANWFQGHMKELARQRKEAQSA